jgi:CubicO group peptidase (beta-lactamase class C family)
MTEVSGPAIELMTHDQLGPKLPDQAFGFGFGIDGVKIPLHELGSPGQYNWGGFFYTGFTIDPKEDVIKVFMVQLHPGGPSTAADFHTDLCRPGRTNGRSGTSGRPVEIGRRIEL